MKRSAKRKQLQQLSKFPPLTEGQLCLLFVRMVDSFERIRDGKAPEIKQRCPAIYKLVRQRFGKAVEA